MREVSFGSFPGLLGDGASLAMSAARVRLCEPGQKLERPYINGTAEFGVLRQALEKSRDICTLRPSWTQRNFSPCRSSYRKATWYLLPPSAEYVERAPFFERDPRARHEECVVFGTCSKASWRARHEYRAFDNGEGSVRTSYRLRDLGLAGLALTLVACSAQPGSVPKTAGPSYHAEAKQSVSGELLYAGEQNESGEVLVFSYPKGNLVQTLTGFGTPTWFLCSDASGARSTRNGVMAPLTVNASVGSSEGPKMGCANAVWSLDRPPFGGLRGDDFGFGAPGVQRLGRSSQPRPDRMMTFSGGRQPSVYAAVAPAAKKQNLLYVDGLGAVFVLTYPGGKLEGYVASLPFNPTNLCADTTGDVFFVGGGYPDAEVAEYAHGGTEPIATLADASGTPYSCAVDPTTGNLAVINLTTGVGSPGNVAIYQDAQGTPELYSDSKFHDFLFGSYDNQGNLLVDGGGEFDLKFAELPAGGSTFTDIRLNKGLRNPGVIQWDGSDFAIGQRVVRRQRYGALFARVVISGSGGTVVSESKLKGRAAYFAWLQGDVIVGTEGAHAKRLSYWHYAEGGAPFKTLGDFNGHDELGSAAVSVSPPGN